MDYELLFRSGLTVFDSALAISFFLGYNKYKLKEVRLILILFPILYMIAESFGDEFDILAVAVSILVSFSVMQILKFRRTTKLKCFLSCVLYYGMLVFLNSIIFNIFYLFNDLSMLLIKNQFEVYVAMCLISKSCLLLATKLLINLEKEAENFIKKDNKNIFSLLLIFMCNILLIVIFMWISIDNTLLNHGIVVVVMVGVFLCQIIYYNIYIELDKKAVVEIELDILKQKEKYEKQIYEERKMQVDRITRTNHDIKGHLMYIAYNIEKQYYDNALKYIDNVCGHIDLDKNYVNLSNETLNFVINLKTELAKQKGIDIVIQLEDIPHCVMEEFDVCILLNNMLDNALEAVEALEDKRIKVEIYNFSGYQVYSVKNKIKDSVLSANKNLESSKKDKKNHGYGIKQIYNITDKYQGCIDIYEKEDFFCVNVLVPRN